MAEDIFRAQFSKRLTQLRLQADVSAREMSLRLGQDEGYINKIENRRILPSMTVFDFICEYFSITPRDFFDYEDDSPMETRKIMNAVKQLTIEQKTCIISLIEIIRKAKNEGRS